MADEERISLDVVDDQEEIVTINASDESEAASIDPSDQILHAVSPKVKVTKNGNVTTVTATDIDGTTSAQIYDGNDDKHYLHTQGVPAREWEIHHNLNKYPSVTITDSAGNEVIGECEYRDTNNLVLIFAGEFAGKAFLN